MSAEAIFRVTQALKAQLQQALADAGDPGTVFIGPLNDPDAQGASLILFLYRIAPNASLRNQDHLVLSDNPPPVGHETINVSLEPLSTEETSRIWTLFPTANYRTSISYVASPVWIDPVQPDVKAARVLQDSLRGGPAREAANV